VDFPGHQGLCVGVSAEVPRVVFTPARVWGLLNLRCLSIFQKDNGPENENSKSPVVCGLRGCCVLRDGVGLPYAGSFGQDGATQG
jgi:hypothetical protein